ncbi:Uncharacterised protein [uncultured archaeon]|nr:Uncharacterised protein [uncultured archaeon]
MKAMKAVRTTVACLFIASAAHVFSQSKLPSDTIYPSSYKCMRQIVQNKEDGGYNIITQRFKKGEWRDVSKKWNRHWYRFKCKCGDEKKVPATKQIADTVYDKTWPCVRKIVVYLPKDSTRTEYNLIKAEYSSKGKWHKYPGPMMENIMSFLAIGPYAADCNPVNAAKDKEQKSDKPKKKRRGLIHVEDLKRKNH